MAPVAEPYRIASQELVVDEALGTFSFLAKFVDSTGQSIVGQKYDVGVLIVDDPRQLATGELIDLTKLSGFVSMSSMVSVVTDYEVQGEADIAVISSPVNGAQIECDSHTNQQYLCPITVSGKVDINLVDANLASRLYLTSRVVNPAVGSVSLYPVEVILDRNTGLWNSSIDLVLDRDFTGGNVVAELALVFTGLSINSPDVLSFESMLDIPQLVGSSNSVSVVLEP